MEFKTAISKLEILSGRVHFLLFMSFGLLIANIILACLVSWSFMHHEKIIVPTTVDSSFSISSYKVDASYLRQMALFFTNERLNLTPQSVMQAHSIVLQYTDPAFYHEFSDILEQEKRAVVKQNISSVFYPIEVIPDISNLSVVLKGMLSSWVGNLALKPIKKSYLIKFSYSSGNLRVLSFSEIGAHNDE